MTTTTLVSKELDFTRRKEENDENSLEELSRFTGFIDFDKTMQSIENIILMNLCIADCCLVKKLLVRRYIDPYEKFSIFEYETPKDCCSECKLDLYYSIHGVAPNYLE
jgi:hypothetical protein